jgi:hypothetical protein
MQGRQAASGVSSQSEVVSAIHATLATFDMWPAEPGQMVEARNFAAGLIGGDIVTPETLAWVHERTGGALFLAREEGRLTGVWAGVLLTEAGVRACHADTFNALDPDPDHVAEKWEDPAGVYAWGIAGSTRESAKRVVEAAGGALFRVTLAHLPYFTRPATPAGVRLVIERFNFMPVPSSTSGLCWMGPRRDRLSAVA